MNKPSFFLPFLFLVLPGILHAEAEKMLLKGRVRIESQKGELDGATLSAEFSSSVLMTQDDFRLKCDHLKLAFSKDGGRGELSSFTATGNVECLQPSRQLRAVCDRLNYEKLDACLHAQGDERAYLRWGNNYLEAPEVLLWLQDERMEAKGGISLDVDPDSLGSAPEGPASAK
ncbi:MAG: hypothetical protein HQL31_00250 [Planctomycetes bacterium]|nr:hypothetical protein [Planctomycetota bacterium]